MCARLVLGLSGRAPVSAVMSDSLHWLSFPQRVTFKLCLLTYKCLHGLASTYLSQSCVPVATVTGRSRLRSADDMMLYVPRTQTVTLGRRAPRNSLSPVLRDPDISLLHFRQLLKTYLFNTGQMYLVIATRAPVRLLKLIWHFEMSVYYYYYY